MNTQKKRFNSRSLLAMLFVLAVTSFVKVSSAALPVPPLAKAVVGAGQLFDRAREAGRNVLNTARGWWPKKRYVSPGAIGPFQPSGFTNVSDASAQLGKPVYRRLGDAVSALRSEQAALKAQQAVGQVLGAARGARSFANPVGAALVGGSALGALALTDNPELQAVGAELERRGIPFVGEDLGDFRRAQEYWNAQAAAAEFEALKKAQASVLAPGRLERLRAGLSDAWAGVGSRFAGARQRAGNLFTRGSQGLYDLLPAGAQERAQAWGVTPGRLGAALTGAAALTAGAAYGINRYRKAQAEKARLEAEKAAERSEFDV